MVKKVIISGGGTGGHIFPAISIANELRERDASVEILFVGANGRMEMDKVPAAGYKIVGLPIQGFERKLSFKNITLIFKVLYSIFKAWRIIGQFRPDVVIGVGGYASAPVLYAAGWRGVPTLIQEQNSYAGVTNKILSRRAKRICVAYHNMERYFPASKIVLTGNPIRKDVISNIPTKAEAAGHFGFDVAKKVLLVTGGSLGARTLNQSMIAQLDAIATNNNIHVIWQTGKYYYQTSLAAAQQKNIQNVTVLEFITKMQYAYGAADVIISRAGAGTISELCVVGKPVILVPSPNVAEDHQTKNAMALVEKNAALLVRDNQAVETLVHTALQLMTDETSKQQLSANIKQLAIPNSAQLIGDEVYKIVRR